MVNYCPSFLTFNFRAPERPTKMTQISFLKDSHRNLRTEDQFYPGASDLRNAFLGRFSTPLKASEDRFCWDFWVVPRQYRLLRTPAESFFGPKLFNPFLGHLLQWGRQNLGCQMISHPWLSAYIDGCHQSLHSDVPHGPWSFVYSLTPWKERAFTGGETLLTRTKLLNYFGEVRHDQSDEAESFIQKVEPKMNRLTLFDPRYPHGVERVQNVEDLSQARLVIHGWFTEPRPMLEGTLTFKKIAQPLDRLADHIISSIEPEQVYGLLSTRFEIDSNGKISSAKILCNHLIDDRGTVLANSKLKSTLQNLEVSFPKSAGRTTLTLPVEFKR